jgi:hypothetical protein
MHNKVKELSKKKKEVIFEVLDMVTKTVVKLTQ